LVGDEAVLFDKVTREFGETITIRVAVKDRTEEVSEIAKGKRGSAARAVLHAELHHAARLEATQTEVG